MSNKTVGHLREQRSTIFTESFLHAIIFISSFLFGLATYYLIH